jgi:hypothetical protein
MDAFKALVGDDELHPLDLTPEEQEVGFVVTEIDNPRGYAFEPGKIRVAVLDLPDGTRAVKMRMPNGAIQYAIWDGVLPRPVGETAFSVAALRQRFRL